MAKSFSYFSSALWYKLHIQENNKWVNRYGTLRPYISILFNNSKGNNSVVQKEAVSKWPIRPHTIYFYTCTQAHLTKDLIGILKNKLNQANLSPSSKLAKFAQNKFGQFRPHSVSLPTKIYHRQTLKCKISSAPQKLVMGNPHFYCSLHSFHINQQLLPIKQAKQAWAWVLHIGTSSNQSEISL